MHEIETVQTDLLSVFNSLPGIFILLQPDAPAFTIVAVTDDYLAATFTKRKDLVGKGLFEVFSDSSHTERAAGKQNITQSLQHVIQFKEPHKLSDQRFDLYNPHKKSFEFKVWSLHSKPVLDRGGDVQYIIHQVEDRTGKITIDVSEQEENIKRLQQSEQQVRAIIESAPFPIGVYIGREMSIQFVNQSIIDVWGKGPDVVGKTYFEVLPELADQKIYEQLDHVYTTGIPLHKRNQRVDLVVNGKLQPFYFNYSFTPLFDNAGKVYGVMNTAADVTDLVTAKQQVEQSERNFRSMILQAPVAMCILLGPDHIIDIANEKIIQVWGKPGDAVMSKPVFEALPDVRNQGLEQLLSEVFHNGLTHRFNERPVELLRNGQYETAYVNFVYQPYKDAQGNTLGVLVVANEVTEQVLSRRSIEQSEEALQTRVAERTKELERQTGLLNNILLNSSNGISVTEMIRDENRNIIDAATILANDAAVKFTGLPREIYLSKTAKEIDPFILESPYGKTCLETLATGEPSVTQYFLEPTGRWLELTISKMDDDHLIHIFTDVTTIKETQLKLEHLVEDLKRSNTNLEEFAYAASHDMQEPIRKIQFFSDRLQEELGEALNDRQKYLFGRLQNASDRMRTLIDDLLSYSRVSRGSFEFTDVDLNQKLQLVIGDLELQVQEKNALINANGLPIIKGNSRQLQQLFQNILNNALKYNKENEAPRIDIFYEKVKGMEIKPEFSIEEGNRLFHHIIIRDNGIGFKQSDSDRIFNVFTRLHGASEYKGTGIGLSIARKVVENHRGYIWAESEPDKGSVFNILLPAE